MFPHCTSSESRSVNKHGSSSSEPQVVLKCLTILSLIFGQTISLHSTHSSCIVSLTHSVWLVAGTYKPGHTMNCKTAAPSSYKVFHWAELETTKPVPHRDWIKQCIQQQHEASVLLCLVWPYIVATQWYWANKKRTKFQIQDKLGDVSATYRRGFMNLQNPAKTRRTCYRHTYSGSRRKKTRFENIILEKMTTFGIMLSCYLRNTELIICGKREQFPWGQN